MNREELKNKCIDIFIKYIVLTDSGRIPSYYKSVFGKIIDLVQSNTEECKWHQEDHEDNSWYSDCGQSFVLVDGSPHDNEMKYCNKCGNKLIEVFFEDYHE